jgi:hypothetical protein
MDSKHGKHGVARDRVCTNCIDKPTIKGKSWTWHCQSKHPKLNKEEVKFEHVSEVGPGDGSLLSDADNATNNFS